MKTTNVKCVAIAFMFCLLLVGCGKGRGYEGPPQFPLSGKVTLDGAPLEAGNISFIPQSDSQRPAGGLIENGQYSVPEAQGANEGTYRVEIRWSKPTGKKFKDTADTGEMMDEVKEAIPSRYNEKSELTANITSGEATYDFDLKSK